MGDKPKVDGWITRMRPDLVYANGTVPRVDVIHLHHGVWLNIARHDATRRATRALLRGRRGEDDLPAAAGLRLPLQAERHLAPQLHDPQPHADAGEGVITYDIDFIPTDVAGGEGDQAGAPDLDGRAERQALPGVRRAEGHGQERASTPIPNDGPDAVRGGDAAERVDRRPRRRPHRHGGHLHPGGLHTDLWLQRRARGPAARARRTKAAVDARHGAHLFRSQAKYFEPAGAVSWDVAMTGDATRLARARAQGRHRSTSTTYDTKRALVVRVDGDHGRLHGRRPSRRLDPFSKPRRRAGKLTHGHLPENDNHGGKLVGPAGPAQARRRPPSTRNVDIKDYIYGRGDLSRRAAAAARRSIQAGQSLTFTNLDDAEASAQSAYHTITACKAPCNRHDRHRLPDRQREVQFDSGELGNAGRAAAGTHTWKTPKNLTPGTYTYFCRIHPFMRGAFRVK